MAEVSAYTFDLAEVTEALIKAQGLTEGKWTLSVVFGFGAAAAGPSPTEVKPAAFVQVQSLQLMKPPEGTPAHLIVDAGELRRREESAAQRGHRREKNKL